MMVYLKNSVIYLYFQFVNIFWGVIDLARYCKICSRVRDNTFFEYNVLLSIQLCEDGYLNSTEERADLDVFLSQPASFFYAVCESCRTCNERQVFSHTQDLKAVFCSVLVRMYLDITMNYFSTLISQISLVHEKTVIGRITWAAKLLLFRFFKLNDNFFLNFLICLMKLIGVSVMLYLKENQNMVLMIFAHIL